MTERTGNGKTPLVKIYGSWANLKAMQFAIFYIDAAFLLNVDQIYPVELVE